MNEIGKLGAQHKYNATVSVGIAATEESFKTLTGKNSPVILHIATHGFFSLTLRMKRRMTNLAELLFLNNQIIL